MYRKITPLLFAFCFSLAAAADEESSSAPPEPAPGTEAVPANLQTESPEPLSPDSNKPVAELPPFQLHTIHKEIWSPVKSDSYLKGLTDSTALQGQASLSFLEGHVSREQGGDGQLSTLQRVLNPRILRGYTMLSPKSVLPDLFKQAQAELDRVRPLIDSEVKKAKAEMDAQLKKPKLSSAPILPQKPFAVRIETPAPLELQVAQTRPMLDAEVELARRKMEEELRRARLARRASLEPTPIVAAYDLNGMDLQLRLLREKQEVEAERLKLAMQAELARRQNISMPEFSAERQKLKDAQKKTAAQLSRVKPELDAILTSMRLSPQLSIPEDGAKVGEENGSGETVIAWDKWYADFARLYEPRLLKALAKYAFPEGENTVSISVWKDHRLEASLLNPDNTNFDRATLEAYNSLSRNPKLAFPAGSHRTNVNFLIDNKHNNSGPVSVVKSKTFKGDREVQGYKW